MSRTAASTLFLARRASGALYSGNAHPAQPGADSRAQRSYGTKHRHQSNKETIAMAAHGDKLDQSSRM
jgi:hypothetical protein